MLKIYDIMSNPQNRWYRGDSEQRAWKILCTIMIFPHIEILNMKYFIWIRNIDLYLRFVSFRFISMISIQETYLTRIFLTIGVTCTKEWIKDNFWMSSCSEHLLTYSIFHYWNLDFLKYWRYTSVVFESSPTCHSSHSSCEVVVVSW